MKAARTTLVGFDATPLEVPNRSGVSHYVAQLLSALMARTDGREYALLASRSLNGHLPSGLPPRRGVKFPVRSLWMQFVLPATLARLRPDLCHYTNYIAPLVGSCPSVVTMYDMGLFKYPETQPRKALLTVRSILPRVAKRADRIITSSYSSRDDIVSTLHVDPERIHVVYAAPGAEFRVMEDRARLEHVRAKYGLQNPFVLAVGTIEPRKNLGRLIEAFARAKRAGRPEHLILVGQLGWKYETLLNQIETTRLGDAVRLAGYIPDEDLPAVYNLARGVAFPSIYEGFGLPVVEGMACGVPVLTSNRASTAEIGADSALLVDPTDTEALADGLLRLLGDEPLREELRAKGIVRAAEFSWTRAAEETVRVYDAVIAGGARQVLPQ